MDGWTDVFTDKDGVRRCSRCQHARPAQLPSGMNSVSSRPTTSTERAANLGGKINQMISGNLQVGK